MNTHLPLNNASRMPGFDQKMDSDHFEIISVMRFLRRRLPVVVACIGLGVLLAGIYALTATPTYKAVSQISADPRRLNVLESGVGRTTGRREDPVYDPARVDSLVEVIKSESIIREVVQKLELTKDPEFGEGEVGILRSILRSITGGGDEPASREEQELATVVAVGKALSAKRLDNTFVFNIEFISQSPAKAAHIANTFGEVFVQSQIRVANETVRDAATWLKDQLEKLAAQAVQAEAAVVEFKRANNLAIVDGRSIEDQALATTGQKLTEAQAQVDDLKAKLDRIDAVERSGSPDLAIVDALQNDVITRQRQIYAENNNRIVNWTQRYGPEHIAVLRLREENAAILGSIRSELRRIGQSYRNEYETAVLRLESTKRELGNQFNRSVNVGQLQTRLAELDSLAKGARRNYDESFQRYLQLLQQQSFPMSEARMVAAALVPNKKHFPITTVFIAIGGVAGLMLGLFGAIVLDLLDRTFRTKKDVEAVTGLPCLGFIPVIDNTASELAREATKNADPRLLALPRSYNMALTAPFSVGAEAIRNLKVAMDQASNAQGQIRVIGISSALAGEGKSTVACNLAVAMVMAGFRVLLLDGDMRNPSLSRTLSPDMKAGMSDILNGQAPLSAVVTRFMDAKLDFVSGIAENPIAHTHELLSSEQMRSLVAIARKHYDYVVIDLPPLLPVVDARAVAPMLDAAALVIEWGVTPRDVVEEVNLADPRLRSKMLGVVLNKVKLDSLPRYGQYAKAYYNKNYFKN